MRRTSLAILTLIAVLITACFPAFPLAEGQTEKPDLAASAYADGFALDISGWKEFASPVSLTLLYVKEAADAPQGDLSLAPGVQKVTIPLPLSLQGAVVVKGLALEKDASYLTQLQAIAEDGTAILSQTATVKAATDPLPTVPTKIAFANKTENVFEGGTFDLPMVIAPMGVTKAALSFTSSNKNAATVDAAGIVTGIKKGRATITASFVGADGKKLTAKVTVQVLRPATQVELNKTELVLAVGKKVSVRAAVSPTSASDRSVTYTSSDETIATVDKKGSIKGLKAGTCLITAASTSNPEITAVCQLTVVVPVSKMTLDAGNATIYVGQTLPISVAYLPQDASIQSAAFKSSAPKTATVDETGVVTGVARGRVTITATAKDGNGARATKTISVLQQPQAVSFKNPPTLLKVGTSQKITAIVSPTNTSDKTLIWSSSDEAIATVSSNGTVKPLYPGKVTITATAKDFPDVSVSCDITVVQPAIKIALSETKLNVLVKETAQLSYVITPDYTTDKSVVWSSSKPQIASVDQNGLVTAHKRGTATITVTCQDGSKKAAKATVNVIQPLYGMTLNKDELRVGMSNTTTLKAVLDPPDASNTKIHWSSDNPNVARVSGTSTRATITGISWGDTEITAIADDGGYTDTAVVHVGDYNKAVEIVQLSLVPNAEGSYTPFIQIKNWSNMKMDTIDFSIQGLDINDTLLTMGHNHAYVFGEYRTDLAPGAVTSSKGFYYPYAGDFTGIEHVKVAITGYTTTDGVQWHIAISDRDWLEYKTADFLAAHPEE
jgi:uncharacterized protein YjdB